MKQKKCKICGTKFTPKYSTVQMVCSTLCSYQYAKRQKDKEWKKRKKEKKKELMTLQDHLKIAQVAFNAFIRARDKGKNCISCGKPLGERYDAGHYYSAGGHWAVRFNEDNVHGQHSRPCNKDLHGDLINYRKGLVERIGEERIKKLDAISQDTANFTIEEVKEITKKYKKKINSIK